MKLNFKKTVALTALLASALSLTTNYASASTTTTATATVQGGTLDLTPPSTITLSAGTVGSTSPQASIPSMAFDELTGTGNGFHITVSASPVTEVAPGGGFASGTSAIALTNAVHLQNAWVVSPTNGTSSTAPTVSGTASALTDNTPATIIDAAANTGMGSWTMADSSANAISFQIPVGQKTIDTTNYPSAPTPYSTTLTWSIVSGP